MIGFLPWAGLDAQTGQPWVRQSPVGNGQGQLSRVACLVLASWAGALQGPAPGLRVAGAVSASVLLQATAVRPL